MSESRRHRKTEEEKTTSFWSEVKHDTNDEKGLEVDGVRAVRKTSACDIKSTVALHVGRQGALPRPSRLPGGSTVSLSRCLVPTKR